MNLKVQLIVISVSFLFAIIYCVFFKYYKNYIRNNKFKWITDLLYNFIFLLIFICLFYKINNLYLNYYMMIFFLLGFVIAYLTVNHF